MKETNAIKTILAGIPEGKKLITNTNKFKHGK